MTTRTRITIPIRGSVHDGEAPDDAGGAVVTAADDACVVVVVGVAVVATGFGFVVTAGTETVTNPGMEEVLWPPEFTAVRLTV
jgi:hypothetical protein